MTWNCRVIRKWDWLMEEYTYAIHEVFYDEDQTLSMWTADPVDVSGESLECLRVDLEHKWEALGQPVLELVPHPSGEGEQLVTVEEVQA